MNEFTSRHFTQLFAAWIFLVGVSIAAGIAVLPGLGSVIAIGVLVAFGISLHSRPDEFGGRARLLFWCFVLLAFTIFLIPPQAASIMAVLILLYWLFFARIWYSRTQPLSKERGYVLFLTTQGLIVSTLALAAVIYNSLVA